MSLYLLLDLAAIAGPLALSFDRRVRFVKSWLPALAAALIVGIPYAAWDWFMTTRGAWAFNPRYVFPARVAWLPLEELLFFLVVPFCCLFIHEVVASFLPVRPSPARQRLSPARQRLYPARQRLYPARGKPARLPWIAVGTLCALLAALAQPRLYTSTVLGITSAFFLFGALAWPKLLRSRRFWFAILLSYVPFAVMNGILTALPVVSYAPAAILGPRVVSIPLEDFLYSFTLLGFSMAAFSAFTGPAAARRS